MQLHEFEGVLSAAKAGSEWAWSQLYATYSARVRGYLIGRGAHDPDGLLGDVFLQLARNLATFDGSEAEFRSWLFMIAHHRVVDEHRRRKRRPELPSDQVDTDITGSAEESALAADSLQRATAMLDGLTDDQRTVLLLRILADLSLEETAQIMGRKVNAVKQLQHRAINALRSNVATSNSMTTSGGYTTTTSELD